MGSSSGGGAGAEKRCADAHMRGPLRDRELKIMRHSHRKLPAGGGAALLFELAELSKPSTKALVFESRFGNAHQPLESDLFAKRSHIMSQGYRALGGGARFLGLASEVHFHKYRERRGRALFLLSFTDLGRKLLGIDRVNRMHDRQQRFDFVGLQMANEVPADLVAAPGRE